MNSPTIICESISDTNFDDKVLRNGTRPSLIVFGAEWSGTCQLLNNVITGVATEFFDKMDFFQIDVEESPDTASMMNIREVPTIFIFQNGEVIAHFSGLQSRKKLRSRLDTIVNS